MSINSPTKICRFVYHLARYALCFCAVSFVVSTPAFADNDDLVGHWKFDETVAGSDAEDSVGSNDGTPTNDPTPSTDIPTVSFTNLRSAEFDGSNYFTITRPISTNFTICAWVKTSSAGGGTNHWESAPIFDSEWGGVDYDFGFGVGNGGKLMFGNGGLVGGNLVDNQVNGNTTINDNEWHNVCATRNNTTGEVKLYVDAELDGSGTTGTGALTRNPNARIGYGYDGAALFDGLIDDMRIYEVVLTQVQLENLTSGSDDPDSDPNAVASVAVSTSSQPNANTPYDASCTAEKPDATPDLFQIDVSHREARLYFTPLTSKVTNYYVSYGFVAGDERFGVMTDLGVSNGVLSYDVRDLDPNTTYHFRVRPYNGCAPGNWSNEMKTITTKSTTGAKFYKNFVARVFSAFPKHITQVQSGDVLGASTNASHLSKCTHYTVIPGDSLWNIALQHLGSGAKYLSIFSENNLDSNLLNPGQRIHIGC